MGAIFEKTGYFLKAHRAMCGLTQQEVADACDVVTQYVSNFERGKCLPPRHALKKLARALKFTANDKRDLVLMINEDMCAHNLRTYWSIL